MNILHIALFRLYRNMKDYKYMLLLIIAPLITILLTGSSTDNTNKIDDELLKTSICYYNADGGELSREFDNILKSDDAKKSFNIENVNSYDEGTTLVKDARVESFIYIEDGFTESFIKGDSTKIKVLGSRDSSPSKLLVEGFLSKINSVVALQRAGGKLALEGTGSLVTDIEVTRTKNAPTGMDNWTYLNMLLCIFYGAFLGSFSVINNIRKNTIVRLNSAPIGRLTNTIGELTGNVLTLTICAGIIIIVTKYIYQSNWDGNMGIILLTFFLFSIIVTSIGMIAAHMTKKPSLSVLLAICLNIFFGNAGISYAIGYMSGVFKWIGYLSPHYYGYLIISDSIFGGSMDGINLGLLSLSIGAAVLTAVTLVLGRRKRA